MREFDSDTFKGVARFLGLLFGLLVFGILWRLLFDPICDLFNNKKEDRKLISHTQSEVSAMVSRVEKAIGKGQTNQAFDLGTIYQLEGSSMVLPSKAELRSKYFFIPQPYKLAASHKHYQVSGIPVVIEKPGHYKDIKGGVVGFVRPSSSSGEIKFLSEDKLAALLQEVRDEIEGFQRDVSLAPIRK
jgi:hypothetical protein